MEGRDIDAKLSRDDVKQLVDAELSSIYQDLKAKAGPIDADFKTLIGAMDDFVARGGKRIRPYLVYLGYFGLNRSNNDDIIKIAAALELLHNFLLIHDDIIDRDYERYHGPNVGGIYYDKFSQEHSDEEALHLANSVALLAGDINHLLTNKVILDSQFEDAEKLAVMKLISDKTFEVIGGEFLDLAVSVGGDLNPSEGQLLNVAQYKTASYSFECPLVAGALLAKAGEREVEGLSSFARPAGIAYQLQDDMLGVFGDPDATGKPITSDLSEGKQTLLIHYGLEQGSQKHIETIKQVHGRQNLKESDVEAVKSVLEESGAADVVRSQIKSYSQEALQSIPASMEPEVKQELEATIANLVERTY